MGRSHAGFSPPLWYDCGWLRIPGIAPPFRNPGRIRFPCKYQQTMVSTMVSKWCRIPSIQYQWKISPFFCGGLVFGKRLLVASQKSGFHFPLVLTVAHGFGQFVWRLPFFAFVFIASDSF